MSTKKVKGLLKGLRYISKVFDDEQEEPEMQIGYPTDVKHVAHIGWDGPDDNNKKGPTWMNDFKPNADEDSSPRPDGHIGDEAKGTKQEKINRSKMSVAIPPKDGAASSPAASPSQNGTKKSRNRRHTSNSPAGSPSSTSGRHRSSRRNQGGSAQGTDPNLPGVPKKVRRRRQPSSEGGSKEKNLSVDGADPELAGAEFGSQG